MNYMLFSFVIPFVSISRVISTGHIKINRALVWGRTVGTYFRPIYFLNQEIKLILLVPLLKMSPLGHMYTPSPHKVHTEFSISELSRNLSWNSVDLSPNKVM